MKTKKRVLSKKAYKEILLRRKKSKKRQKENTITLGIIIITIVVFVNLFDIVQPKQFRLSGTIEYKEYIQAGLKKSYDFLGCEMITVRGPMLIVRSKTDKGIYTMEIKNDLNHRQTVNNLNAIMHIGTRISFVEYTTTSYLKPIWEKEQNINRHISTKYFSISKIGYNFSEDIIVK